MRSYVGVIAGVVTFMAVWLGLAALLGAGVGVIELSVLGVVAALVGLAVARRVGPRRP